MFSVKPHTHTRTRYIISIISTDCVLFIYLLLPRVGCKQMAFMVSVMMIMINRDDDDDVNRENE